MKAVSNHLIIIIAKTYYKNVKEQRKIQLLKKIPNLVIIFKNSQKVIMAKHPKNKTAKKARPEEVVQQK